jgi:hypothetical protein
LVQILEGTLKREVRTDKGKGELKAKAKKAMRKRKILAAKKRKAKKVKALIKKVKAEREAKDDATQALGEAPEADWKADWKALTAEKENEATAEEKAAQEEAAVKEAEAIASAQASAEEPDHAAQGKDAAWAAAHPNAYQPVKDAAWAKAHPNRANEANVQQGKDTEHTQPSHSERRAQRKRLHYPGQDWNSTTSTPCWSMDSETTGGWCDSNCNTGGASGDCVSKCCCQVACDGWTEKSMPPSMKVHAKNTSMDFPTPDFQGVGVPWESRRVKKRLSQRRKKPEAAGKDTGKFTKRFFAEGAGHETEEKTEKDAKEETKVHHTLEETYPFRAANGKGKRHRGLKKTTKRVDFE